MRLEAVFFPRPAARRRCHLIEKHRPDATAVIPGYAALPDFTILRVQSEDRRAVTSCRPATEVEMTDVNTIMVVTIAVLRSG
jgi:hypothetical protein